MTRPLCITELCRHVGELCFASARKWRLDETRSREWKVDRVRTKWNGREAWDIEVLREREVVPVRN